MSLYISIKIPKILKSNHRQPAEIQRKHINIYLVKLPLCDNLYASDYNLYTWHFNCSWIFWKTVATAWQFCPASSYENTCHLSEIWISDIRWGFKEKAQVTKLIYFKRPHDILEDRKQQNNHHLCKSKSVSGHRHHSRKFVFSCPVPPYIN